MYSICPGRSAAESGIATAVSMRVVVAAFEPKRYGERFAPRANPGPQRPDGADVGVNSGEFG